MPPYNIQKRDSLKLENITMNEEGLQGNLSQQELVRSMEGRDRNSSSDSNSTSPVVLISSDTNRLTKSKVIDVSILCFINLINYMDRYTVAG